MSGTAESKNNRYLSSRVAERVQQARYISLFAETKGLMSRARYRNHNVLIQCFLPKEMRALAPPRQEDGSDQGSCRDNCELHRDHSASELHD